METSVREFAVVPKTETIYTCGHTYGLHILVIRERYTHTLSSSYLRITFNLHFIVGQLY